MEKILKLLNENDDQSFLVVLFTSNENQTPSKILRFFKTMNSKGVTLWTYISNPVEIKHPDGESKQEC